MKRRRTRPYLTWVLLLLVAVWLSPVLIATAQPLSAPAPLPRVESQRVEVVSRVGGLVTSALPLPDGSTLVAEGPTLVRLVFDGAQARPTDRRDLGHGLILDMLPLGEDTLVVLSEEGVSLLEMAGSSLPEPLDFVPGSGQMLAVHNRLIAVAARDAGLRLLRASPTDVLTPLATLPLDATAEGLALSEDGLTAYIAAGVYGVQVIDLDDPAAPHLTGVLGSVLPADAVGVAGPLLVVASHERVYLVDPARPSIDPVGVYAPLREGRRIAAAGDYLYVADAQDGLKIFWLAEPDHPVQIYGEIDRPALDLYLEDNLLYLLGPDGLRLLDVGSPFRPVEMSSLVLPGSPQAFDVTAERIFVALGESGVGVVSVENRAAPNLIRRIPVGGVVTAVARTDEMLYAAAGDAGLALIDLSQPGGEELINILNLPVPAVELAARGRGLFVVGEAGDLLSLNIEQPAAPVLVSVRTPVREPAQIRHLSLSIDGRRAFLADGSGYTLLDVGAPEQVGELARYEDPAADVAALGDYLYSVASDHLTIYDASASIRPAQVRTYRGIQQVGRIGVAGERVFLSSAGDESPSLVVLNIAAPDYPVEADSTPLNGEAFRAWAAGETLWLARGYRGLSVYRNTARGVLALESAFGLTPDTARLAVAGDWLAAGGRAGWSLVAAGEVLAFQGAAAELPARALAMEGDAIAVAAGEKGTVLYTLADNQVSLVGQQPGQGPTVAVALDADYVYSVDAAGLAIYDRRFLAPVTRVALPAPALDIALHDTLAFLPLNNGQMAVVSVADPAGGLQVRTSLATRRPLHFVQKSGLTVYGLSDDRLLRLGVDGLGRLFIDATGDLLAPGTAGFFQGDSLWVLTPGSALREYDIGQLGTRDPDVTRRLDLDATEVVGNRGMLYVASAGGGLTVRRAVGPAGELQLLDETVRDLRISEDWLFAVGDSLTVWDLSDPAAPVLLAALPLTANGQSLVLNSEGQLLVSTDGGLMLVGWNGSTLTQIGQLLTDAPIYRAVRLGTWAFLARQDGGLQVVDVSNPAAPQEVFTYVSGQGRFVEDLLAWSDTELLISWSDGVELLDTSQLSARPRLLGTTNIGTAPVQDITFLEQDNLAALALGDEGVVLLDVSEPLTPAVVGFASTPGEAHHVAVSGETMAIADGVCGVRFFDVGDPAQPVERGFWLSSFAGDVAAGARNLFYLAEANQLLTLRYDASAPPSAPPVPQMPQPLSGQDGLPLSANLTWGPPPDPCDPLVYDVYLGIGEAQELAGRVAGVPALQVADLEPLRTYRWQVRVTDRQGDVSEGPVWQFTTAAADFVDDLPPAPPLLLERLRSDPSVPVVLISVAGLAGLAGGIWVWWRRRTDR